VNQQSQSSLRQLQTRRSRSAARRLETSCWMLIGVKGLVSGFKIRKETKRLRCLGMSRYKLPAGSGYTKHIYMYNIINQYGGRYVVGCLFPCIGNFESSPCTHTAEPLASCQLICQGAHDLVAAGGIERAAMTLWARRATRVGFCVSRRHIERILGRLLVYMMVGVMANLFRAGTNINPYTETDNPTTPRRTSRPAKPSGRI
jgi:hypothetical protein